MYLKIKTILILVLVITITTQIKAQSIGDLDKKSGYYGLTLGDSYQKWNTNLDVLIDIGVQKSYFFKSINKLDFLNYPVNKVITTFKNQQLISITIDLGIWDAPKEGQYSDISKSLTSYTKLVNLLKSLYGNPIESNSDLNSGKVANYWEGKSHFLLCKLNYKGATKGSQVSIEFGNKNSFQN